MLRTLFFVDVPHRVGGAQRSLLNAIRRIDDHGIAPIAVFPADGTCVEMFRAAGIDTRVIEAPPSLLEFGKKHLALGAVGRAAIFLRDVVPYSRRLVELARRESIDVWHFNTPRGILVGGVGAKLARRPAVMHLRGIIAIDSVYWGAAQALADRMMLVARSLESSVWSPFRRRISVVHDGIDLALPRDRRASRVALAQRIGVDGATLDRETLFVSLSSPVPFKGLHHLVDAAAILADRGVAARWLLAGTSEGTRYLQFLERRIAERGLRDRVHVLGYLEDPRALLAAGDALVLPSVEHERLDLGDGEPVLDVRGNEGFPLSILEAFAEGRPVVASRVAGVPEEVDEAVTGYVVPPGDVDALADALGRVAGDTAWRELAGRRAREVVAERFTLDALVQRMAAVLREAARSDRASA